MAFPFKPAAPIAIVVCWVPGLSARAVLRFELAGQPQTTITPHHATARRIRVAWFTSDPNASDLEGQASVEM